jgi:hypothetical protein
MPALALLLTAWGSPSCRAHDDRNVATASATEPVEATPPRPSAAVSSPNTAPSSVANPTIADLAREAKAQSATGTAPSAAGELPEALRGVGQVALLSATGEPSNPALQWRADPWPSEGSGTLAALSFIAPDPAKATRLRPPHVFVLERKGASVVARAHGEVTPSATSCMHAKGNSDLEMTIAPSSPRIATNRTALPVRVTCTREAAGGTASTTELFLFDGQGDVLVQVLETVLDRTTFDRPSGRETTEEGTLSTRPSKANGYNDIEVRVKRVERTALLEAAEDSEATTQRRVLPSVTRRYQWNGRRYEEAPQ